MKFHALILAPLAALLTGCAIPDLGGMTRSQEPSAKAPTSGPYSQGPVVLFLDGTDGPSCQFNVQALYPIDIEPHSIEIQMVYVDLTTGAKTDLFGGIQMLPLLDVDWTKMTAAGAVTKLTNWPADVPCAQGSLRIEMKKCWKGNCPRYIAGENQIPMELVLIP